MAPSCSSQARAVAVAFLCLSIKQTYVYEIATEVQSDTKNVCQVAPKKSAKTVKSAATKEDEVQFDTNTNLALVSACGSNGLRYISVVPPCPSSKKSFVNDHMNRPT